MDLKKPRIYALIVVDVVTLMLMSRLCLFHVRTMSRHCFDVAVNVMADVATFQLWYRGSTFDVATLNVNVATLKLLCCQCCSFIQYRCRDIEEMLQH